MASGPASHPPLLRRSGARTGVLIAAAGVLAIGACNSAAPAGPAGSTGPSAGTGTVHLYTSVTQATVDTVVAAFGQAQPGISVEVFRAPTGELNARIASERRDGKLGADLLWLTDPLSMQPYAADGTLRPWTPTGSAAVKPALHTDLYWGTRILSMVIVRAKGAAGPADWMDLTQAAYKDAVAIPDPGFAGSAFGALGYFGLDSRFGIDYYRKLKANGASQVKSPDDVVTGVAEGRLKAGMTLDSSARAAIAKGSPIELVWPTSGAIAMYSPIGIVKDRSAEADAAAQAFAEFVISRQGQEAIAKTGWQPVRDDVTGPPIGGSQVTVDWDAAYKRQKELLEEYRSIFGG